MDVLGSIAICLPSFGQSMFRLFCWPCFSKFAPANLHQLWFCSLETLIKADGLISCVFVEQLALRGISKLLEITHFSRVQLLLRIRIKTESHKMTDQGRHRSDGYSNGRDRDGDGYRDRERSRSRDRNKDKNRKRERSHDDENGVEDHRDLQLMSTDVKSREAIERGDFKLYNLPKQIVERLKGEWTRGPSFKSSCCRRFNFEFVSEKGITYLYPIQIATLKHIRAGDDVIAQASKFNPL